MDSNDPNQNGQDYQKNISESYQEYENLLTQYDQEQKSIIGLAYQDLNQKLVQKMREQIEATLKSLSESSSPIESEFGYISEDHLNSHRIKEMLDSIASNNTHFVKIVQKYQELFPKEELKARLDWNRIYDNYREQISQSFDKIGEILSAINKYGLEDESKLLELYRYLEDQRVATDHIFREGTGVFLQTNGVDVQERPIYEQYETEEIKPTLYDSLDSCLIKSETTAEHQSKIEDGSGEITPNSVIAEAQFQLGHNIQSESEYIPRGEVVFDYSSANDNQPRDSVIVDCSEIGKTEEIKEPIQVYEQPIQPKSYLEVKAGHDDNVVAKEDEGKEDKLKIEKTKGLEPLAEDEHSSKSHRKTSKEDEGKEDKKSKKEDIEEKEGVKELKHRVNEVDEEIKKTEDSIQELKQIEEEEKGTVGGNDVMEIEGKALLQAEISRMEGKAEELKKQKEELEKELDKFK